MWWGDVDLRVPRFRRNLWLLLSQNLAAFFGIAVQQLVLNLYLVSIGYREDFVGVVAFVQTAAIGLGAFPASAISPRVGPRRLLIGATVVLSLAFGAMAVVQQSDGLLVASALFGFCHLWVGKFPNWRMALVAGVAGVFYGMAFQRAGGIRASMVSHALTATTFRVLFS